MALATLSANILIAYTAYAFGAASPGPSNLAVMAIAMNSGRRSALSFALGVVSGSTLWGLLAAFGLSAVMTQYSFAVVLMKLIGGVYLLWLSFKSLRAAMRVTIPQKVDAAREGSTRTLFFRGLAMHFTNPKAIFVWLSIITLSLSNTQKTDALPVVLGCSVLGMFIFCGYALLFSTVTARRVYSKLRRCFEGVLAAIFGAAAVRMLVSGAAPPVH